ncbi:hypothetical protein PoB_005836600 [Plakobranchus ocellatus]|uniref:Uncharacterized protein n=1 Tax=Plakobranchus ocellatus TaxID=259542 RepID=A0AAV4CK05_9GAST|nr:hypothetical protein PoB_005836600 [Plakobranchus ocellatus]
MITNDDDVNDDDDDDDDNNAHADADDNDDNDNVMITQHRLLARHLASLATVILCNQKRIVVFGFLVREIKEENQSLCFNTALLVQCPALVSVCLFNPDCTPRSRIPEI